MQEMPTSSQSSNTTQYEAPDALHRDNDLHPAIQTLSLIARLVLGVVFLAAGAWKLGSIDQFAHEIANYKILPDALTNIAALLLVWTELAVGVLLIAGAAVRGAALVGGAMMLLFIVAIISAIARGLEIDCGCFGPSANGETANVGWPKVFQDVAWLAIAIFLIYFPKSWLTIDRLLRHEGREGEAG